MIEPVPRRGLRAKALAGTPLLSFVTLGIPAGAIGVAWPDMRASFDAPLAGLGLLLAAWTAAYFLASATSGPLAARLGTLALLIWGCGLAIFGLLGLSFANRWWMVPMVSLLVGGGSGLIDATVNAHISLNRGVRYMGWLHASWALGASLGPQVIVISLAITGSWRASFAAMAAAFLAIGLLVWSQRRDWVHPLSNPSRPSQPDALAATTYRRALLFLTGLFLVGGGLEATVGDWSYTQLTVGRSVSDVAASWGASLFWAGLAAGRVVLGLLGNRVLPALLLDASVGATAVATLAFWLAPPLASAIVALPLLGFAVSVVFPLLLSLTPTRVGKATTAHAVGYQLAAGTLGSGSLPAGTGLVLQAAGVLALGPLLAVMAAGMVLLHFMSRSAR